MKMMKKVSNVKKFIKEKFIPSVLIITLSIVALLFAFGILRSGEGKSMNHKRIDWGNGWSILICNPFEEPQKGDIVRVDTDSGKKYNKRLIAGPNDTVKIKNKKVYVNGDELIEDYAFYDESLNNRYVTIEEFTLGEDEYFVLGDNRIGSLDSSIYYSFLQRGKSTERTIGIIHSRNLTKVTKMIILDEVIDSIIER